MAKSLEQLLIGIEQNQQLVDYHSAEVRRLLREYVLLQGPIPLPYSSKSTGMKGNIKSLVLWTEWLAENQPAHRQTITDATGIRLSEKAKPRMIQWSRLVDPNDDDAHPADTLCCIQDKPTGRGRPQLIYFLWSQRWDVHPLFGVGPIKPDSVPDLGQQYFDRVTAPFELTDDDAKMIDGLLTSVPVDEAVRQVVSDTVSERETPRFATVEEWNEANAAWFDAQVASESKPTTEQKQALLDTLPHGTVDGNTLIAVAYSEAVKRARQPQTLLGVVYPPTSEG